MSRIVRKLHTGDILLVPTYYYFMPQRTMAKVIDFGQDFILETIEDNIKKMTGEEVYNQLQLLIPQDIKEEDIGIDIVKKVIKLTNQKYVHAEIYLKNGWSLQAFLNGTKLMKYKPSMYQKFDVCRFKGVDEGKILELVDEYWNLPYDYTGKAIQLVGTLLETPFKQIFGIENLEDKINDLIPYKNAKSVTAQSLIGRMLSQQNISFEQDLQTISLDDIVNHERQKIL